MGFKDFWINNNGKKEQLHDAKHGVRKEQVDKKYHNLFDVYDTNQNGTLEENELSWLLSAVKNVVGEDNTLDDSENAAINARFKEELNIENADFKEFVKSVSKASEDIKNIEEKTNTDGSKSLVTQYKDGTKETITYYADGEYKFKKTEKLHTKTRYWINAKEISKEEYEKALKNTPKVPQRTDTINLSVTNISSNTVTVPEIKEEYSKRFEVEKLLDSICKNLEAGELQKIKERFASLIQQNPEQNWLEIVENAKQVLEKNNMPATFENLADALESLDINLTIRNEAEYELSSQKREEIELRKFAKEVLSFVYETVSAMQQDYHDNQGLADFGFYSEQLSDLICKLGGESNATRSFAQAAKNNLEFAKQAGDIPVINKELFDSEFKKMNGANLDIGGVKKLRDLISKKGFDFQKDIYSEEFNSALKGMLGSSGIESAQSNLETGSILNGLGDIIVMVATLGLAGEAKTVQLFGKTAMQTFGKAGAKLTAHSIKLSNPLAKGTMKFAGKVTSLGGGAVVGGTHLAAYTGAKETVNNLTNPTRDALSSETWNMTSDAMAQSFGFGAFGGIWGQTVTSKVMNAVNRTSGKTMSVLAPKFAEGNVKGVDVLKAFLKKSAPDNIAKVAEFASELVGFTAYESALSVFLHIDREVTLDKVTDVLWEEFKNQGYTLGQIKAVSMLLMGSKAARAAHTGALESSFDWLKNVEVCKHPEKNEFIVKMADGKSVICKNENEMISTCMLLARGGGVNGRVDKGVNVNAETKISENPVADALTARERAAANGEIPALKDVEFEEGFGLTYKASTNLLSKGDYYFVDKKLATTKKDLSEQLKADGIVIDLETECFIEKLKTKEEIQNASAFFYQAKRIPELCFKYDKLVKEPQDAVILGMLVKQNPCFDYEVAINQIKNNPILFKLYEEVISLLKSDVYNVDRTYMLPSIAENIKNQEQCEGFLHLVKNLDDGKFGVLEQLVEDKLVPNDVKDVERFLKVIKYTNDRGLRYNYLSLSPEVSEVLNPYLEIKNDVNGRRIHLSEYICDNLIKGLDLFKKMYENEEEKNCSIFAEICACYTEKTAEFIEQVLKDGIFTPSEMAESLLNAPLFSKMDGTYNARIKFYNEFKTNSRFNHEEFKSVLGQIKDKNMNLALTLCRNQNFPQKMIAPFLCSLDGANMEFAAKLCKFNACPPDLMPAILQKYQGGTDEVVFEFIKNGQLQKTPELLKFTTDLWKNIINRNLLECDFVDGKPNRISIISNYARAKTEHIADVHRQLVEDAFANKDLLKTGLEDITDRDINSTMTKPETIRALDLIGKGNLEAAFPLKLEEFEDFVDIVDGMELSVANKEALVQKLTPLNSQKYQELNLLIKQHKQALADLVGAENIAKSNELKVQQAKIEEEIKQLKKSGNADKKQIKELINKVKSLGSRAQAIYYQGENAPQIKELMKTISNESKNLQQMLKENNGIDPQEVVTKLRVLSALSRISTEDEIAEFIDMVKVSTPENDSVWNNAVNKKIFQKLGVEYDEALSQKLDLVNCKYISKMFVSSTAFFRNMEVLVDEIKDNPELTVEQAIDRMPQNIKTKEIFESLGFDYEKFTKVDKNSYEAVKIELNGDEAKQAAIRNIEEDLNDELFRSLPKEVTEPIFVALQKELGVTLELSQKENWAGDGFSAGTTDYYRLFKNGKPITFENMDDIVSLIKKEINANDFWSTTQADVKLEIARGTMYTHLIKMRTQEVDNALNIKDGEVAEIEVRKTDMYDVKKALGLGNDAQCCTALGRHFNEWSAPTYIMNKCIGAIELTDKGSFVGNTMIYLAYVDGKPALVLDNIELKTKYQNNDMIRDAFVNYAKKLCEEIGQSDLPIYAGPNRHKLNMEVYSKEAHSMEIIGNSENQPVYVDYDAGAHYVGQGERVTINMYKLR